MTTRSQTHATFALERAYPEGKLFASWGNVRRDLAIAWPLDTAPIVSATSLQQLKDLIAAPNVKLDAADVAAIDKASAP